MPRKLYTVHLNEQEREQLETFGKHGKNQQELLLVPGSYYLLMHEG